VRFRKNAKPFTCIFNGTAFIADPHEFSTGSFGWMVSRKLTVFVDGVPVTVQIGCNLTICGSKEVPASAEEENNGQLGSGSQAIQPGY
jgi:hypothetical protein